MSGECINAQTIPSNASGGRPRHPLAGEIATRWLAAMTAGQKLSAKSIFEDLRSTCPNNYPELRTVQAHIKTLKAKYVTGNEPPKIEWKPWRSGADQRLDAEAIAYLLQVNVVSSLVYRRGIYETEAVWGARLRVALEGLDLFVQLLLIREYALSERLVARRFDPQVTATTELDQILGLRPWDSRQHAASHWVSFLSVLIERGQESSLFEWVQQSIWGLPGAKRITWRDIAEAVKERAGGERYPCWHALEKGLGEGRSHRSQFTTDKEQPRMARLEGSSG